MSQLLRSRNAIALGAIAVAVAATAGAYAATSGGGKITVCVHRSGDALYKAAKCKKHDKKLTWNKQGLRGPRGLQGPPGPKGDTGTPGAVAGYSASNPGYVDFTAASQTSPQTILTLSLPAGSFIVSAKTTTNETTTSAGSAVATCTLSDGGASDEAQMYVPLTSTDAAGTTLPMSIAVGSAATSTVTLSCWGKPIGTDPTAVALDTVITAVQTTANH